MRTRTIFDAYIRAGYEYRAGTSIRERRHRHNRQISAFSAELLRRMDAYDEQRAAWHSIDEDPPIDTPLLVMHDDGSANIAGYVHRWTGQLAYCNIDENWGRDFSHRTHWRTFPPPPPGTTYSEMNNLYGPREDA